MPRALGLIPSIQLEMNKTKCVDLLINTLVSYRFFIIRQLLNIIYFTELLWFFEFQSTSGISKASHPCF